MKLTVALMLWIVSASAQSVFFPMTPCRVLDTRIAPASAIAAHGTLVVPFAGKCSVPATATAYSLVVTAVPSVKLSYLTMWQTGQPMPLASSLNGPNVNGYPIVAAGVGGAVSVYTTDKTDLVIDVMGYFAPLVPVAGPPGPVGATGPPGVQGPQGQAVSVTGAASLPIPHGLVPIDANTLLLPSLPTGPVRLVRNGLEQNQMTGLDYTVTGRTITLGYPVQPGDTFVVWY